MLANKNSTLAILLGAAVIAVLAVVSSMKPKENFFNIPSRTWKVEKVIGMQNKGLDGCMRQDFFQTPNFQSILSPRFSNVNYGPNLRTRFPEQNMMGVPEDPLNYNKCPEARQFNTVYQSYARDPYMVNSDDYVHKKDLENRQAHNVCEGVPNRVYGMSSDGQETQYMKNASLSKCAPGEHPGDKCDGVPQTYMGKAVEGFTHFGVPTNPRMGSATNYANGDYAAVSDALASGCGVSGPVPTDTVMESSTPFLTPDGEMKNPIVYDRYIVANRNSRLRGQGDPIRGDLPIIPQSGNWFTPNVHPNIDLQPGAMNVLGGINNETSKQVANLIYNSSGRADTTIGGVDMAQVNISNQVLGSLAAAGGDVHMSAFP